MTKYKIIRMFRDHGPGAYRTIKTGLTLEEAQAHCRGEETISSTCTAPELLDLTEKMGPWFDGYDEEKGANA